jgi:hypothetical protein
VRSIAGRPVHSILAVIVAGTLAGCGSTTNPTPQGSSEPAPASAANSVPSESPIGAASQAAPESPVASSAAPESSAAASAEAPAASASPESPVPATSSTAKFDAANFVAVVDNPWFPLKPGTTYTYRGAKEGTKAVDVYTVTRKTKVVAGVKATVVHDELFLNGRLAERTDDWYAQDKQGNVWYLGEATAELNGSGNVIGTGGSWETGVNGARPGIYMPAQPRIGVAAAQEHFPGEAEDYFVVLLTNVTTKVPIGSFKGVLVTAEWTPLEPNILTKKFYAKGLGELREADVVGGDEKLELTKVTGR